MYLTIYVYVHMYVTLRHELTIKLHQIHSAEIHFFTSFNQTEPTINTFCTQRQ